MSDALTSETPEDEAAVETPAEDEAVDAGSVDSADVIPKKRFDGLMSTYQAEKRAAQAEIEGLRAEIDSLQAGAESETTDVADQELLQEVRALQAELANERIGRARADAIAKFPAAAPLADLIVGESPEAIEQMAETIAARLTAAGIGTGDVSDITDADETDATDTTDTTGSVEPPVIGGGGGAVDENATFDERKADAIANKDWSGFLAAAYDEVEANSGADL